MAREITNNVSLTPWDIKESSHGRSSAQRRGPDTSRVWRGGRIRRRGIAFCLFAVTSTCTSVNCAPKAEPARGAASQPLTRATTESVRRTPDPLEDQWRSLVRARPASSPSQTAEAEQEVLKKLMSNMSETGFDEELKRLAALPDQPTGFDAELVATAVSVLAERGDGSRLTTLLASHCPRYVGARRVEYFLATSHLSDPVSVLAAAAQLTKSPSNRLALAQIMAEAFGSKAARFHIPELENAPGTTRGRDIRSTEGTTRPVSRELQLFLTECRNWYSENREHLRVNGDYDSNDSEAFTKRRVDLYVVVRGN